MINCSKFVCSKKLLDTILLLLDSIRANNFYSVNWSTAVLNLFLMQDQLDSISFTFSQKNINCSNCKWSTKVLENVNCSTQFIVKKMVYMYGSQVRGKVRGQVRGQVRLGQVYMYGSWVRCQVRLGQVRLGQVRLGQVRLGQVRLFQVRLGQVRLGQTRSGQARFGQVRLGQVRLGQVRLD